jgi:hypothetical protein
MKEFLIILAIFLPLVLVYVLTYFLNSKAKIPEGVEPADKCNTCHSNTCSIRDMKDIIETVKCEIDLEKEDKGNQ